MLQAKRCISLAQLQSVRSRFLSGFVKSNGVRRCSSSTQGTQQQGTLSRAWKTFRESPNTKYWLLGLSAAASGTYYFVEKDQRNKQVIATVLPPTPAHYCHPREHDVEQLLQMHKTLKKKSAVTTMYISGMSGIGKSQLARLFAEKLDKQQKDQIHILPGNEIIGTLKGDTVDGYLLSLKGLLLALKCSNSDWISKLDPGEKIQRQDIDTQIRVLTEVLREKLSQSPGWIMVVDNVYSSDGWLKKWLPGEEGDWGKGTLIVTSQVPPKSSEGLFDSGCVHHMKSMGSTEASELLHKISGLPEDVTEGITEAAEKLQSIPLALAAAGTYIQTALKANSDTTFNKFLQDYEIAAEKFKVSNPPESSAELFKELAPVIISAAMATKALAESDPHLLHGFDFLASCPEQNPVPISLLCYHLKKPEYGLPIAQRTINDLLSLLPTGKSDDAGLEEELPGIWSVKGVVQRFNTYRKEVVDIYKQVKSALGYGEPFTMPELDDGMGMLRNCNLLTVIKEKPGDTDCIHVHPVIHLVLQQLYLSLTAPLMEEQFLQQAQDIHNHSSWFRRLWAFDPQTKLQEYRNGLGEKPLAAATSDKPAEPVINHAVRLPKFTGFDVHEILSDSALASKEEYRQLGSEHLFKHLQEHWGRVIGSITSECTSGGADVKSQAAQKFIIPITTCILASHLPEELGSNTTSQALIGLASVYSNVCDNAGASKDLLEHALQIQEPIYGPESMEVADVYTHLAITHNSLDNIKYSKELLEKAMDIYEMHRKKSGEYKQPTAYARTLGALGVVIGTLGDKQRSKELLEKAIMVFQTAQPSGQDEAENRKFAMDIASNLTDLGHAYLCLGQLFQGWKVLELSLQGHKNLHGDKHPEVIRALTVLSIAKMMQGNDIESRRLRQEAGKLEKSLAAAPTL